MNERAALRRSFHGAAALLVIGAVSLFLSPAHAAADAAKTIGGMTAESWYTSAPAGVCSSPVGCPAPLSGGAVYPADTLHIGVTAGNETARTYVVPDLSQLPPGATILSAALTLPVSSAQGDGTSSPELASVKACLATKPVPDGKAGDLAGQPDVDCAISAAGRYDAKANAVSVDIVAFIDAWQSGVARNGVALFPDTSTSAPTDAWHLALNGRKRSTAPHVSLTLSYDDAVPVVQAPEPPVVDAPTTPRPPLTGLSAPVEQSAPVPPPAFPGATVAPAVGAPISVGLTRPVALSSQFRYPMVFLLPFAIAAGLVLFARMFVRDVTAADPRVSWAANPLEEGR
jgi:hypothetical protein